MTNLPLIEKQQNPPFVAVLPEEIAAERAEEEAYLQREREDAARDTRERQSALALQLACEMIRETTGSPSDALDAARDFLAFLTGEPKTQITN